MNSNFEDRDVTRQALAGWVSWELFFFFHHRAELYTLYPENPMMVFSLSQHTLKVCSVHMPLMRQKTNLLPKDCKKFRL